MALTQASMKNGWAELDLLGILVDVLKTLKVGGGST